MKKLLLVDNLTLYNLFFLLLYRLFGFRIIYLDSTFLRDRANLILFFESLDIKSIDYTEFKNYDFESSFNLPYQLALNVHNKLLNKSDYKSLSNLFKIRNQKKAEIAMLDMIRKYIGNLSDIFICADYYSQEYRVFLWHKRNFIIKYIDSKYKNLNNFFIHLFLSIFIIFTRVVSTIFNRIKSKFNKNRIKISSQIEIKKISSSSVIFFPHKGLKTANSYEKNLFYSDDESSPLHPKNIEYIEYGLLPNTQEYKAIQDSYVERNLNYRFIPRIGINSLLSLSIEFIKKRKFLPFSSKDILMLSLFINLKYYLKQLEGSKHSKVAIVGYDYLFPKALSLSLDILDIHTIAYQERYLSAFVGLGSISIDTYFVWNDKLRERIDRSGWSFIGESISLGCVKIGLFDIDSHHSMIKIKKRYKQVIVALDYHSASSSYDNKKVAIPNWKNNLIFYRDMIKLAVAFPSVYIIIRGKDAVWCDMKVFEDIYNIIESIDNIEVNREFTKLNISYQLVKDADLVIGRYTSLMEESMAYGVPVISCDYGCNFVGNIKKMYDGDSCFTFVQSYEELNKSVNRILNQDINNLECIESLYKTVKNPQKIIINKIEKILEKKCR